MMKQNSKRWTLYPKIRTRLTLPFLVVVVLTAGLGVYVVTNLVSGSIQERVNNHLLDSAQAASNTVADIERQQLETLRQMAFTIGVNTAVVERDVESLKLWLQPIAANQKVDDLIVFDEDGKGILRLTRQGDFESVEYQETDPPDLSSWQSVNDVIQGKSDVLGDKYIDIFGHTPDIMFYFTAPIITDDKYVVGGISIGISAVNLSRQVSEQTLSAVTIFENDGEVLGSTFRVRVWEILNLIPAQVVQLNARVKDVSVLEESEVQELAEEQIIDRESYQTLYVPLYLRSQQIGLLGVSLQSNFIVEDISTSRNRVILVFSFLFFSVIILGLISARSITKPVSKLVDTTRAIRQGDLSRRVKLRMPDELGELSLSFDHMTDQLVARNEEISDLYYQQLQETAQREAVLKSIRDAVIVQDFDGRILMRNHTAENLLAAPVSRDIVHALLSNPELLLELKKVEIAQYYFDVQATPVKMETGDALGYVIVFHDITAIREAENLKDELMKQMSHELRTPLSASRNYVELVVMLDHDKLESQSLTYLHNSLDHSTTLERMINQVVEVSQVISTGFSLNIRAIDLRELVEHRIARWQPIFADRDLELIFQAMPEPLHIQGDFERLEQVMDHILRNAYSYTLPGGKIQVQLGTDDEYAIIVVEDTGVGIDDDEIDKVFERLYRGRSADAGPTDTRGLGLGLFMSRYIMEAHRGHIWLKSQHSVGTSVTLELPR